MNLWSYYGRKSKFINLYPKPKHDLIIEPFAGTAVYSLHEDNWKKEVILLEKYDVLVQLWKYLQQAKPENIIALPDLSEGQKVDEFTQLTQEEKWLIGFCINRGSASPKKTAKKFNSWDKDKIRIANNIHKIKHWTILQGSYEDIPNQKATWFIDPPYQNQGKYYRHNNKNINFEYLGEWSKSRLGQVIVCENIDANWLNFQSLIEFRGQLKTNTESIWYKEFDFDNKEKGIEFLSWELAKKEMELTELKKKTAVS